MRRIILYVLALAFLVGAVTDAAWAEIPSYNLWVGGTQVTSANANDIPAANGTKSGTASYNSETNTLTLNNYNYEGEGCAYSTEGYADNYNYTAAIYISSDTQFTILLSGTNKITNKTNASDNKYGNYGIYSTSLIISGDGSLDVSGGDTSTGWSYGIYSKASMDIQGNVKVNATGGAGMYNYGIYCTTSMDIQGNVKVKATGGTGSNSRGIYTKDINITGSAELTATGGTGSQSYGIYATKKITITDSADVTATGGSGNMSYGIFATTTITIKDSATVNATGGEGNYYSDGIYAGASINIQGNVKVNATGGTKSGTTSYGIYANNDITITDSADVTVTGGDGSTSYGIYANTSMDIQGNAKVNATGGTTSDNRSYGIYVKTSMDITGNAAVTTTGGDSTQGSSYGIWVNSSDLTMGGSANVNAAGGKAESQSSMGIFVVNNIIIKDSADVTVTGGTASSDSHGIYSSASIDIQGNVKVNATGGTATNETRSYSTGIRVLQGMTITNSADVTATGGNAIASYGIEARASMDIQGDVKVNATGGTGSFSYGIKANQGIDIAGNSSVIAKGGTATMSYGIFGENTTVIIDKDIASVVISGDQAAFMSGVKVSNDVLGLGWTNTGKELIAMGSARTLSYKKAEFPAYSVTFKTNGATSADFLVGVLSGDKITKPADPTKTGYTFIGWYKEETLNTKWSFDTDIVTESINLYARWHDRLSADVNIAGAGTVSVDEDAENGRWKLTATANTGFTFNRWSYKYNGTSGGTTDNPFTILYPSAGTVSPYSDIVANFRGSAKVTVAPTAKTLTYNGSAQELVTAGTAANGTMQYTVGENNSTAPNAGWITTIPKSARAGTYYVWYKVSGDENYDNVAAACVTVTISRANPTVTAPTAKTGLVYNGSAQELVTAGSVQDGTMQYSTDGTSYGTAVPTETNAGTYTVYYKADATTNYNAVTAQNFTVTIAKADPTVTAPTAKTGLVYNGSAQELVTAGSTIGGTLQYALGTAAEATNYSDSIPTATDAGTYYVWYKVVGDENYSDVEPACVTVTIAENSSGKTTPTVTAPTAKSLTYTGSAQTLVNAGTTTGGTLQYALGTAAEATGEYSESIPTATDAGTYYVWYRVVGDENYNDVAPACVTVIIKEYDDEVTTTADNLADMSTEEKQAIKTLTLTDLEDLTKIDYSQLENLTTLKLSASSDIETVNLSALPDTVETFSCAGNSHVTTLTLENSTVKNIEATSCDSLVSVDLEGNDSIESLDVSGSTKLTTVKASGCENLKYINCSSCWISSLDVEACSKLVSIDCSHNSLLKLDIKTAGLPALNELNCVSQSLGNWKASLTVNFNDFMESPDIAASHDTGVSASGIVRLSNFSNVRNLKAYDRNNEAITVTSDDNGNVIFAGLPDRLTYDYETGFESTDMDVEVFAADSALTDSLSSSGGCGGCNAMSSMEIGLRNILIVIALELLFMAKKLRRR